MNDFAGPWNEIRLTRRRNSEPQNQCHQNALVLRVAMAPSDPNRQAGQASVIGVPQRSDRTQIRYERIPRRTRP